MRRILPLLPVLLLTGCGSLLDPATVYREAARNLRFSLESAKPSLDIRFPLDRSALRIEVVLGMENPSAVRLRMQSARGLLWLERNGQRYRIGELATSAPVDLEPRGRGRAAFSLSFAYNDLKSVWEPLSEVTLRGATATWRLEGQATTDILGIPLNLPFNAVRETGRRP